MKQFSFIHVLLFILMLLVYHCSHAQDYVLPLRGDTLKGIVRPTGMGLMQRVQISAAEGKKKSFGVVEVREYRYKDQIYRPVRGAKGYVFMQVIRDGYLGLYAFQPENQTNYDGRFLLKKDGSSTEVPNLTFKKTLSKFLAECPSVVARIESGEFGRREVEQIVETYNACISTNTTAVNAEIKKLDPLATLEQKVKDKPAFEAQKDALEMITEIKRKVQSNEKVPNFLIDGLKRNLASQPDLNADLDKALKLLEQ